MLDDVRHAKIVITNFHAFKLRERVELSKGGRQLLQGRVGQELGTQETTGHPGDRRADAATCDARSHGDEEYPGHQ